MPVDTAGLYISLDSLLRLPVGAMFESSSGGIRTQVGIERGAGGVKVVAKAIGASAATVSQHTERESRHAAAAYNGESRTDTVAVVGSRAGFDKPPNAVRTAVERIKYFVAGAVTGVFLAILSLLWLRRRNQE